MQVPVYSTTGEVVKNIEISDAIFAVPFNEDLIHQAVLRQMADARQGTHDTKTRGEVAGSGKKLHQQKHTGEARAGDRRSPLRRKGGIIFGPHPRDHRQDMPKKMRQLALKSALSAKAADKEIIIVDLLKFDVPKTKDMVNIMGIFKLNSTALIVTAEADANVVKSARNIPGVKIVPANILNVLDVVTFKMLLMTESAVRKAEQIWGGNLSQEGNSAAL